LFSPPPCRTLPIEEFIAAEEPRTKSVNGQRPQVSSKYHYNRAIRLRRFAAAFPNTAVCDLANAHIDTFLGSLDPRASNSRNRRPAVSGKSRNHHRAAARQFLQWASRKDYLSATHRLNEADSMRPERAHTGETQFYTRMHCAHCSRQPKDPCGPSWPLCNLTLIVWPIWERGIVATRSQSAKRRLMGEA
jgi:hypothetical protein